MKKLSLELETLSVETFKTTAESPDERGTVHGRDRMSPTPGGFCVPPTTECYPSVDKSWCGCGSVWCETT
jgi:hypothetical protein